MLTAVIKAVKMLLSCPKNSQDAVVLAALKAVKLYAVLDTNCCSKSRQDAAVLKTVKMLLS
jgi:hypothetical protein